MRSVSDERLGKILIAAGGTGGHVFPAQALAHYLYKLGFQPTLVTDRRGMEFGCDQVGIPCHLVYASPFSRRNWFGILLAAIKSGVGMIQARFLIRQLGPVAAVGFGGYASLPTMLIASHMKLPTVIHESNAVLGRANRLLASRVSVIATAFQNTAGLTERHKVKVVQTGTPVRASIVAARKTEAEVQNTSSKIRLLVIGGSQGSRIMSEVVPAALGRLPQSLKNRLVVVHQCRLSDRSRVKASFAMAGVNASVISFINDMGAALECTNLVISRAGASTVAELAVAGRAALLVPFPHAVDDHQAANARELGDVGGAWIIDEKEFNAEKLGNWLVEMLKDPSILLTAGRKAGGVGRPDAAHHLAEIVGQLISESAGKCDSR